ncbi:hypothetical protein ACEXOS_005515 [Herbiconiux sp. P16]|uniref:hypothetical protein n=1 Tax=Herbiconiux wuyangfengii TaxID=3342794 RepID=UPI0035BAABE8
MPKVEGIMNWGDVPTWIGAIGGFVAAIAAVVTVLFAWRISAQLRDRERRQALADLHLDLTTGETAHARHVIGTAMYGEPDTEATSDAIAALFALYWAVQRVANLRLVHASTSNSAADLQTREFLTWNLDEIVSNIIEFRRQYREKLHIRDKDAWRSFIGYVQESLPERYNQLVGDLVGDISSAGPLPGASEVGR